MNKYLEQAKNILISEEKTCVLYSEHKVYTSIHRGVRPLLEWLEQGILAEDFYAADKVVGKATAFLYVLLKVQSVYTQVISRSALQVLQEHQISVEYEILTENIINRKGDGICPFEKTVLSINDPEEAYTAIKLKWKLFFQ